VANEVRQTTPEMLRITVSDDHTTCKLEGKLAGCWVAELDELWRTQLAGSPSLVVDLSGVSFVDGSGRELLSRMHARGAKLTARSPFTKGIVEQIVRCCAVVWTVLLLATAMRAQDAAPLRLTLKEAVQLALRQNPQVQIANLNLVESQQDRQISRSALLPQVSMNASERVNRINLDAFIGEPFPGFPQHIGPFEIFQGGAVFSAPIFDLNLWRRWQASRSNVTASGAREQTVREQLAALVVSQYLGGLRAAADVKSAQSRVELAQALYDQAADMQKNGVGTGIDTLRANVELQNEQQRLISAQTDLKTTLYGLARLLNLKPEQEIALADEVSFFQTPAIAVDQSIEAALVTRPEMKALTAQREALHREQEAARAERLPVVTFSGDWAYQGLSPQTSIPTYVYAGNVDIPLFTGGRIQAQVARADLELKKLDQQQQEQKNAIALEVKTAVAQLEAARHEVSVANLGVDLAREEVSQARDRFAAGVANNIEVISAQDALARANDNQIQALYRYNQARADLARAAGQMQNMYAR
jgi:outer membrane protein TolC/anti-anti-sigma regulatory factor